MSLDWSVKDVKDWKTVCFHAHGTDDQKLLGRTETVVWMMLFIGMTMITEANKEEVYQRTYIYERVIGGLRTHEGKPVYLTYEDICAHVGLRTNVSKETRTDFVKKLERHVSERIKDEQRKQEKAA